MYCRHTCTECLFHKVGIKTGFILQNYKMIHVLFLYSHFWLELSFRISVFTVNISNFERVFAFKNRTMLEL